MRNLKRALSLALASVMLLGMMVVGTSAASYPDVDENDNVEAIEVLNAVNVMIGRQGNFEPDEAVNRHEMAVIMAKLVLGVETADNYVGSHPFTDVVPWADKYVAACYENGLVAGTSATTYGGSNPLTAVQAAAMMLRALGYKDLNKGYQGDWRAPITAKANEIRLFSGVAANPNEKLNRNQVAQLALNTLKSPMVTLIDGTFTATGENGQLILTGGAREYKTIVSGDAYAKAISDVEGGSNAASSLSGFAVELGEHLYNGKLRLDNNDIDAFGRPARTWEYDGKTIGTYAKTELLDKEYVGKVTGKDLYDLLGSSTIKNYDLLVEIDGVEQNANAFRAQMDKNNKASVAYTGVTPVKAATGTGVVTEVYTDSTGNGTIYIAIINTYLAQAAKDYDAKKEELTVTVYGVNSGTGDYVKNKSQRSNVDLALEDFPNVKDMKKDDFMLVNVAEDEVVIVSSVEALEGVQVSSFKKGSNVTVNGQKYDFAETAYYDNAALSAYTGNSGAVNLKDTTYNIYLDEYDNLIGIKEVEAKKNYVFITGVDDDGSYIANKTGKARALFLDGTSDVIEFNAEKSKRFNDTTKKWDRSFVEGALVNTWCTYTKTSADVYTLTEVADAGYTNHEQSDNIPQPGVSGAANTTKLAQFYQFDGTNDKTIDKQNITLAGGGTTSFNVVYGNKDTVYLTAKLGTVVNNSEHYGIINGVENVTVGAEKANLKVWDTTEAGTQYKGAPTSIADGHANGVYTLYNNNGVVIAAVVVGEDSGAAKNLVYAHTGGLEQEGYGNGDTRATSDEWDWSRKVIKDGEEVLLTEKGDASSYLEKMEKGYWYQVKLNADGDVIDAGKLDSSDPSTLTLIPMTSGKTRFVTDNTKIGTTVSASGVDTVLYSQRFTSTADGKSISTNGWTLYVTTQNQAGFLVHENAKIVLQQYDRNTQETYITEYVGADNLKGIVDEMNERNIVTFKYQVNAVLEHGVATSVVINSETTDWNPVIGGGDAGSLPAASWNGSAIEVPYYKTIPSIDAVRASVESVIGPVKTVSYTWAVTEDGAPYSVLLKEYIAVKVDGVPKIYTKVGATNGDITGLTDGVKYLKDVKYKATADYTVASKKITVGGTAVAGTDVELYTAYSVALENSVTASDGTNTITTGQFVATGTEVTFTGNLTSGRRSFTVDGETYGSVTTGGDKATMKLPVTKNITVGEAASYKVVILGHDYGEWKTGDGTITFTSSVPKENFVAKVDGALAANAVDSITAAGDTREYTVDKDGDASSDGVITIVEAYTITAQTEGKVTGFGTTWSDGADITGTITAGTTFVEPGTKVFMHSSDTTRTVILNPLAAADDKAGITVKQEGADNTNSYKVASFTMPKHTVAASAFCWDKYTVATQADTNVALYTDEACTTAVTDGGLYDVGTTLYVKCAAGYATATKPAAGYTKLTDKSPTAGETGTFVMQPGAVANNAFTASNA